MLKQSSKAIGDFLQKKWSPIRAFAGAGQINHVDLLLRHGVDINSRDTVRLELAHLVTFLSAQLVGNGVRL